MTGDSRGAVSMWDGTHGTAVASFRRHGADVLSLAASADGSHVFAAGVDPQVALLRRVGGGVGMGVAGEVVAPAANGGWVYVDAKRPHTHDVRCLVLLQRAGSSGGGGGPPVLVSGSNDAQLIAYAADRFTKVRSRGWGLGGHSTGQFACRLCGCRR